MRNLPGLEAILSRAAEQAQQEPTYRFHGRKSPANRERTEVYNKPPGGKVKDGVATLRLYEPIDSWGGFWGVSALEFLDVLDELPEDVTEIQLHINSPGGEVWEALAILNSLRAHDAKIVATVDGIAASAASFIACAADELVMMPNTQLMIHDAWGICIGNAEDMHSYADVLGKVSDNIAAIYADRSGKTVAEWRDVMKGEAWYTADEAVEAGLADRVGAEDPEGSGDPDAAEDPAAAFDLKGIGCKYAGRAEAPAPGAERKPAASADAPVPDHDSRRLRFQQRRHAQNARRTTRTA